MYVYGDFHQASETVLANCPAAGAQCSMTCLMAIALAKLKSPIIWTKTDMNEIINQGSDKHVDVLKSLGWPDHRNELKLDIDELPNTVIYKTNGTQHYFSVGTSNSKYGFNIDNLMQDHFREERNTNFIMRIGDKCLAVFQSASDHYSVFDPHSCNQVGKQVPDGKSYLIHLNSVQQLITHIESKLASNDRGQQIDVYPVDATFLHNNSTNKHSEYKYKEVNNPSVRKGGTEE